jgi:Spy/CpxP family protein refolding chaperone
MKKIKKWYFIVIAVMFAGLGIVAWGYGYGGSSLAGPPVGFRGPLADSEGFSGPATRFASGGFGPEYRAGFGPGFQGGFGPSQYLNLSEEQLNQMRELRNRIYGETEGLRNALAQKQLEMQKFMTDPKADEAALLAKQKEMSSLREQLFDRMALVPLEMRKILSPEQIQKLGETPLGFGRMRGLRGGPFLGPNVF